MTNSTHLVKFSTIPCYNSTIPPQNETLSIEHFRATLIRYVKYVITTKDQVGCFFACQFNGKARKEENVQSITMLVLDVDNKQNIISSLDQADSLLKENLSEYEYFYYTTKSSSETTPRMRVIVFLKDEVSKQKYKNAAQNFIDTFTQTFKDSLDTPSTMTINRLWFMPYRIDEEDKKPHYHHNQGKLLDLNSYYDESLKQQLKTKDENHEQSLLSVIKAQPLQITKDQIIEDLKIYPAKNLDNNLWFEALAAIHHQFSGNETGLKIADYWSSLDKRPNQYKGLVEIQKIWDRLSTSKSNVVTWATIKMRIAAIKPKEENKEVTKQIKLEKIHPSLFPEPNMYFTDDGKPKYKPKCSVNNSSFLFDYYGIKLRDNLISKDIEGIYQGKIITDMAVLTAHVNGMFAINDFPTKEVKLFMDCNAKLNPYNPFKEFVLAQPWDKQDRLQQLFNTVNVDPQHVKIRNIYLKHWLLELMKLTCFNDGNPAQFTKSILIFQSEEYGLKKTEWFNYLFPPKYISKFFHDGGALKLTDHMSKLECLTKVVCELGEVGQTLRKQDIDSLKAFISTREDVLNRKYDRSHQKCRRMTLFCGSTNDFNFLEDKQGYGRFLVLPIKGCNAHHGIDMQQVYAQLYTIYEKDGWYELSKEEEELKHLTNSNFVYDNPLEDQLNSYFDFESKERPNFMLASEILEALGYSKEYIVKHKKDVSKIKQICKTQKKLQYREDVKKFYLPPIKDKVGF